MAGRGRSKRPNLARWFWYACGGTLPERYSPWVLHDLTAPNRHFRQIVRTAAVLAPLVLAGLVVVGTNWIVWVAALGGFVLAAIYSVSYTDQYAEYRLHKHGFAHGTFQQTMAETEGVADKRRNYESRYRSAPDG